jgi:hypothetical protein
VLDVDTPEALMYAVRPNGDLELVGLEYIVFQHAWAWKPNPTGDHQDWNPKVLCPNAECHTH